MAKLPEAYESIILPLIGTARGFLENGENLAPIAFIGNFTTRHVFPVPLDSGSDQGKDESALMIKGLAEMHDADFIFMIMEAWSLRRDKVAEVDRILERYGSIGASPYAVDIVAMSLETRHGVWMAEVPIKPKGVSKKKRTIGAPDFRLFTEVEGRFVHLLPRKDGEAPTGLH